MRSLSCHPFHFLRVGDRVKSQSTGREGFISKLKPMTDPWDDDNSIIVRWDPLPDTPENMRRVSESCLDHYQFEYVWLM